MPQIMFPPQGARPSWDAEGTYTVDNVEAFVQLDCVAPLDLSKSWPEEETSSSSSGGTAGAKEASTVEEREGSQWLLVPPDFPLGDLMSCPGFVVPGGPVFHLAAKGTKYHADFIRTHNPSVIGYN